MIASNGNFMKAPIFSDDEQNRKAYLLRLSSTVLFLSGITGCIIFIVDGSFDMVLVFNFMLIGAILSVLLLRFGHMLSASWTLLLWILVSLMLVMYIADGIHDTMTLLIPILIMVASMLFERRNLIAYFTIVLLSIQAFIICELTGMINNPMSQFTSFLDMISVGILMFISIVLTYKMSESIRCSFLEINKTKNSLTKINQKLQNEMKERNKIDEVLKSKVNDLEMSDKAALNIMEDLNETVNTLRSIEKKLAVKNKELEDYTYTVSHDLKAPLVTIQGFSDLLAQNYNQALDDKGRHYIDRINQGSERLNVLISDLLELSRAGRKLKPFEWHDFNEILHDSLESLEGKIVRRKVRITHPDDFPKIYGDSMRLSQVMNNLVDNAVNYMGDQKNPRIDIGWKESGDCYEFWVQDNGIGIKEEDQGRIFNIFERVSEQGAEGSGIGLSIAKKVVETHDGEIHVESEFGKGSKFIFTMPKTGVKE